ncbi:MAG: alpha/beta hydrolase family protein [Rubrivivax sp.]
MSVVSLRWWQRGWVWLTAWPVLLLGVVSAACAQGLPAPDTPQPSFQRERWLDTARQRHVMLRIAWPAAAVDAGVSAWPVLLMSSPQGFRWSGHTDHYVELSREMVRRGVVMVTVSHVDADEPMTGQERFADVYPGVLTGSLNDPSVDRFEDLRFVLRELERLAAQPAPGRPRLDLQRVAVAGHSSGTLTALQMAGMPVRDRHGKVHTRHHDPRIKAFVVYSWPLEYRGPLRDDLAEVGAVAGLHVAGSQDMPAYRNTAYRYVNGAPQHWLVVEGGHNVGARGSDALVLEATGSFIDVYLKGLQGSQQRLGVDALGRFGDALKQYRSKGPQRVKSPDQRDFVAWARETLPGGRWLHDQGIRFQRQREEAPR